MREVKVAVRRDTREQRKEALIRAMIELLPHHPIGTIQWEMIGRASGLNYWSARRRMPRLDRLAALAIGRLISDILTQAGAAEVTAVGVHAAVRAYVARLAKIMRSDSYSRFIRILLRDGYAHPWLHEIYQERLASPLRANLIAIIELAGRHYGAELALRDGAPHRFLRKLEAALIVSCMLPDAPDLTEHDENRIVDEVTGEIISSIYDWNMLVAV
jgi:hypothetical protein